MRKFFLLLLITLLPAFARAETSAPSTVAESTEAEETVGGRAIPNLAVGVGGYFLEPHEVTNAASHSAVITGRPMLVFRVEQRMPRFLGSDAWVLEPHFGFVLPEISEENMARLSGFLNFDVGHMITDQLVFSTGVGVNPGLHISTGSNVDVGGEFVTPSGTALTWLFTNNFGVGYWVDPNIRVDAGTSVVRLFSSVSRRFRYFIEVAYAF